MIYVSLYLVAIVLANLSVAMFGPSAVYVNAFIFIGFDITARDKLHDAWKGSNLVLKMTLLILTGSILSWAINHNAGQIAIASFVAFGTAAITDSIVYHLLRHKSKMIQINGSNLPSSLVDSIVFPSLAFGAFVPAIIIGQFLAKAIGGAVWSIVLKKASN